MLNTLKSWVDEAQTVAVATVLSTWGSSPRRPGSQLLVHPNGHFEGSVSGGCVEGATVREALEVLAHGTPRVLTYGVSDAEAGEVGLACGGRIEVLVEAIARNHPLYALSLADAPRPSALVTRLSDFSSAVVLPDADDASVWLPSEIREHARSALRSDSSIAHTHGDTRYFIRVLTRPLRMLLVGAVHIAQALTTMAELAGFEVTVIDPRRAFASEARFAADKLCHDWPDEALLALAPDARTAVITLTHDAKLDEPALEIAVRSDAFYVGALGSRATHRGRCHRLLVRGVSERDVSRIHGPVGYPIVARHPGEIAASILAHVLAVLRGERT